MPKSKLDFKLIISLFILVCAVSSFGVCLSVYSKRSASVMTLAYSVGSQGSDVESLQRRLADLGYYFGPIDGIYGNVTYNAVMRFQGDNGLTVDGIAGVNTFAALGISIEDTGLTPNTPLVPEYSNEDIYLLASVIYGESRGEPLEGQIAVGAVILNRVRDPRFPNTISGVIYQTGAFDAVADGQINLVPNETAILASVEALSGDDPSGGAVYYWNPEKATSAWIWSVPIITQIGNHVFGSL